MRVPCSVSSSAARSASVKTDASRHAATKLSRNELSPAFAASLVCMSRQKPQPLIWLARIFISSWVAAGSAESTAALFAETRYLTTFVATSLVMMSRRGSMVVSLVVCSGLTSTTTQPAGMSGDVPTSQFGGSFRRTGEGRCDHGKADTMSTQSGPGGGGQDPGLSAVMAERRQLMNLAYRLLGSLTDAEDVVQETYARWYAMTPQQQQAIESPGGWLMTVASRICLDLLGSARARRERYVGEWIPEPLPERSEYAPADPADRVTLDESVNMAFLVVLESMTPAERGGVVLQEVFRSPLADVA